jgi:hypothetical protein
MTLAERVKAPWIKYKKCVLEKQEHNPNCALNNTYPLPKLVYPHQNKIGSMIMKKVWVPRFAEIAKYESRAGDLRFAWNQARYGVSHRIRGKSCSRRT